MPFDSNVTEVCEGQFYTRSTLVRGMQNKRQVIVWNNVKYERYTWIRWTILTPD